jgi:hypothetical protein
MSGHLRRQSLRVPSRFVKVNSLATFDAGDAADRCANVAISPARTNKKSADGVPPAPLVEMNESNVRKPEGPEFGAR